LTVSPRGAGARFAFFFSLAPDFPGARRPVSRDALLRTARGESGLEFDEVEEVEHAVPGEVRTQVARREQVLELDEVEEVEHAVVVDVGAAGSPDNLEDLAALIHDVDLPECIAPERDDAADRNAAAGVKLGRAIGEVLHARAVVAQRPDGRRAEV